MAENGPAKINLKDFQGYFEQHSPVPQSDDQPFILDYETKDEQGLPDPQKYNENRFEFTCVITTKRLLRNAIEGKTFHADSTYKLNWMGYPVHVFGITDYAKKFHLVAIAFSVRETAEVFQFCFQTIKDGIEEVCGRGLGCIYLMSDAAPAIKQGFEMVFPFALKLACWFHVEENLRKRKIEVPRHKASIMKDVQLLHLSPNVDVFDIGADLFYKKWMKQGEIEYANYFKAQWMKPDNKYWFAGSKNLAPCTNNALESTNEKIKRNFNFRNQCKMNVFKEKLLQIVRVFSTEYRDNIKNIDWVVPVPNKLWQAADEWSKSKKEATECERNADIICFNVASGPDANIAKANLTSYNNRNWKTFDSFSKNILSIWVVTIFNDKAQFTSSTCTCPAYLKDYLCKHILGMGLRLHKVELPDNVRQLETKPSKRGRPKRAGPALSFS